LKEDTVYKDEKGIINYNCNLIGINDKYNLIIKHNNAEYNLETNLMLPLYSLLSDSQKEQFEHYFVNRYEKTKFKVKLHDVNINHEGYIFFKEEEVEKNLSELIEKEVKNYITNTNKPSPIEYFPEIKKVNQVSDITVSYQNNDYNLYLDLLDTNYIKFSKEDKRNIDNILIKKMNDIMDSGKKIKVIYSNDINYAQKVDIQFFKNNKWQSLKEEMTNLLKPHEEKCEQGRNVFKAIVANVVDGDTIDFYDGDKKTRVRLNNLEANESRQTFGSEATKYVTRKIYGKEIKIEYREKDKYNRMVATLYFEKKRSYDQDYDINQDIVKKGFARSKGIKYISEERFARTENLGIWKYDGIDPEVFRKNEEYYLNKQKENKNKNHWRNKQKVRLNKTKI
jgi:micrococcal nuclease